MLVKSWKLIWLTIVICFAGCLFGYDSGIMGSVLTFPSFSRDFNYTAEQETTISSIAVGIQQAGAFVGSLVVSPITKRYGRKWVIAACGLGFSVGVAIELIPGVIGSFYAGRVVAGIFMGASATIVPTYLGEMAPKEQRGRLGSCYQLFYTIGILVSYWIGYGVKFMAGNPRSQWQIPIGLQMAPAMIMGLGILTVPESVRWLITHDKTEQAWASLVWVRNAEDANVQDEFEEIKEAVLLDKRATEGFKYKECFETQNFKRIITGFTIFVCQQSTGATAIAYFSPQFFSLLVGPGDQNLLLSGIFGAVKFVACLIFVLVISERFGRKPLLLAGSGLMSICMIITAIVIKVYPPGESDGISSASIGTVALLYINIIIYNASWGPLPWPCTSELFPNRIREVGTAVAVSAQWLFNFVYSFSTPYMMDSMGGFGVFLFYGILDIAVGLFAFFCLKETRNKTLEEIDAMYNQEFADARKKNNEIEHLEDTSDREHVR